MKLKLLAAACGLALGGQAFALTPAATDANSTVKIYATGSSAAQRVLITLSNTDCVANSADYFQLSTDTGNVFGVSCTLTATAGGGSTGLGGKNIFFVYNAAGGSAYGIYSTAKETIPSGGALNTAQATVLQRPFLANLTSTCDTGATIAGNPGKTYTCSGTSNQWADIGITDTEPALHNIDINTPPTLSGQTVTPDENAQVDSQAAFQQVFGVAVSQALYNDLQAMQVALGLIPSGGVPSLSKSAVANYLSGGFTDPSSGFGWQPLFATSPLGTPSGANGNVLICTRVAGSGTKSGANAYFLNNPCGGPSSLSPATAAQNSASFTVSESAGTSGVKTCLTNAGTSQYAIGIIGHDNAAGANSQFVAIDGVQPSRENARAGLYDWFVESWMQWNTSYITNFKTIGGGATASQVINYLANFRTRSGSPDVMAQFAAAQQDGVLAIADGQSKIFNDPSNANNKKFVARATKLGNSCSPSLWSN
ncbi:MAG TPA: hypothetical protein VGN52_13940 [Burkholderiales bacterium]|jgi:hypothetical protein